MRYVADGKTAKATGDARLTLDPKSVTMFGEGPKAFAVVEMEHEGRIVRFRPPRNVYVAGPTAQGVTFDLSVAEMLAGSAPAGGVVDILSLMIATGDEAALSKFLVESQGLKPTTAKATAKVLIEAHKAK